MSIDQQAHVIPYDLEEPIPILFWDPLEFTLAITLIGFGIISKLWVMGLLAGGLVLIGSKYLKRGAKRGAMQHFLWARGLNLDSALAARFKPSYHNDFIE